LHHSAYFFIVAPLRRRVRPQIFHATPPRRHEIFLWLLWSVNHAFEAMFQKKRSVHDLLGNFVLSH
jgi:hypothetical protein